MILILSRTVLVAPQSCRAPDLESFVLRHRIEVLQRNAVGFRLTSRDRAFRVTLSRVMKVLLDLDTVDSSRLHSDGWIRVTTWNKKQDYKNRNYRKRFNTQQTYPPNCTFAEVPLIRLTTLSYNPTNSPDPRITSALVGWNQALRERGADSI